MSRQGRRETRELVVEANKQMAPNVITTKGLVKIQIETNLANGPLLVEMGFTPTHPPLYSLCQKLTNFASSGHKSKKMAKGVDFCSDQLHKFQDFPFNIRKVY